MNKRFATYAIVSMLVSVIFVPCVFVFIQSKYVPKDESKVLLSNRDAEYGVLYKVDQYYSSTLGHNVVLLDIEHYHDNEIDAKGTAASYDTIAFTFDTDEELNRLVQGYVGTFPTSFWSGAYKESNLADDWFNAKEFSYENDITDNFVTSIDDVINTNLASYKSESEGYSVFGDKVHEIYDKYQSVRVYDSKDYLGVVRDEQDKQMDAHLGYATAALVSCIAAIICCIPTIVFMVLAVIEVRNSKTEKSTKAETE